MAEGTVAAIQAALALSPEEKSTRRWWKTPCEALQICTAELLQLVKPRCVASHSGDAQMWCSLSVISDKKCVKRQTLNWVFSSTVFSSSSSSQNSDADIPHISCRTFSPFMEGCAHLSRVPCTLRTCRHMYPGPPVIK